LCQLIEGYISGDGFEKDGKISCTTISKDLALSICIAIAKAYKVSTNINYNIVKPTKIIEGRVVNQQNYYTLSFFKNIKKQNNSYVDGGFIWLPFKSKQLMELNQDVFNLEIENDNTYTANNIVVHNCQSFSFAGKRKGMSTKDEQEILTLDHYLQLKSEGYEFEGQSYLFWEYMRLLNEVKPTYFLLENVMMGEKWEKVLSKAIGVKPIEINSALVSAQNRRRLYWTNIGLEPMGLFGDLGSIIEQPKDKGILLKDILDSEVDEKYYLSEKMIDCLKNHQRFNKYTTENLNSESKSSCLSARLHKMGNADTYIKIDKAGNVKANQDKSSCFTAGGHSGGNHSDMDLIVAHNTMPRSSKTGKGGTGPLSRTDGKTYCLDTGSTNAVEIISKNNYLLLQGVNRIFVENFIYEKSTFDKRIAIKALLTLWRKIREEKNVEWKNGSNVSFYEEKILQPKMYGNGVDRDRKQRGSEIFGIPSKSKNKNRKKPLRKLWSNREIRYTPQGRELEKQLIRQFAGFMQKLSQLSTQQSQEMYNLWDSTEGSWLLREALPTIQKIWRSDDDCIRQARIRRLTVTECERLQTVNDGFTAHVSDSQRYKMLGNGWTIDVIVHIFSYIPKEQ
jgi:site-specific DNA-cytosine methylase